MAHLWTVRRGHKPLDRSFLWHRHRTRHRHRNGHRHKYWK